MKDTKIKLEKKKKLLPILLNKLFSGDISFLGVLLIIGLILSPLYIVYKILSINGLLTFEGLILGISCIFLVIIGIGLLCLIIIIIEQDISQLICTARLVYLPLTEEETLKISDNFKDFKNWFYENYTYGKMKIFGLEESHLCIEDNDLIKIISICQKVYGVSEEDSVIFFRTFSKEYIENN